MPALRLRLAVLCIAALAAVVKLALLPTTDASARSSVRVGLADRSPAMFDSPHVQALNIKRTRWNEVNHKTRETWNRVGNTVSYFKRMYSAVRKRCKSCTVVGLDLLDQVGVERYIAS